MNNYKKDLSEKLLQAVKRVYEEAIQISYIESETGFHCDYAMSTINPVSLEKIKNHIKKDKVKCSFELSGFSGVYEDGNAENRILQRIYVTAFSTPMEMEAHKQYVNEAIARDHKTLGHQLKFFSSSDDIGTGLTLWHPKGAIIRCLLENFSQTAHILNDYQWVYTPHIGKADLWKTSGHLDFYKESMYNPIVIDNDEYYLKPMNCPFHINIYNSEIRSYRDLPVRYAEFGTVYRYELSGALNGLTRVRGFTQDDAHIICMPDQANAEVLNALLFSLYVLKSFGLENYEVYVSTRPDKNYIGDDHDWDRATDILKNAVISAGLDFNIDEGGGAFYGPKIDLKLRDALHREWQCSTIQFDFNLPTRFDMHYIGKDGNRHTPFMIHRALFGSIERFMALLIEHYKGDFPFWLAPIQFGIVPIKESHNDYAKDILKSLKIKGFRATLMDDNNNMRSKIKQLQQEKVPFILVVGDKEIVSNKMSIRSRGEGDLGLMQMSELCNYVAPLVEQGQPQYIF